MEQVKQRGRAFISIVLSMLLVLGGGIYLSSSEEAYGASAVANPTPKIDIAVTVPADYPGTFLDYKAELEEKLIAEGMDPNDFRITNSAVQIDTTDLSDWYVYDHYGTEALYNTVTSSLNTTQKEKQPYRVDPFYSSCGSPQTTVEAQSKNKAELGKTGLLRAWQYDRHIWSTRDAAGKAKMVFAGYYQNRSDLNDFMIYPASSDSRRTISFDIDANNTHLHSMLGAGFLLNAGISGTGDNATIHGYLLFYKFDNGGDNIFAAGTGTLYLLKFKDKIKANTMAVHSANATINATTFETVKSMSFNLGTTKKARLDIDLQKDKVTIQQRNYKADGNFDSVTNVLTNQALSATGYNGFGPLVGHGYSGHGCASCSSFTFSDLEMTYEADAFDGLKSSQFYERADFKYFINLAGTSNNPSIPDTTDASGKKAFDQGIERLGQNEIFYISNWNDGHVLTNEGVTTANGLYATSSDSVGQIARYIATNFKENVKYDKQAALANIATDVPLADFYLLEPVANVQALTLHLAHLDNNGSVSVRVQDKSIGSNKNGTRASINGYQLRIYDPNNNVVKNTAGDGTTWIDINQLYSETYTFSKGSAQGRYTFELTVKDANGLVSTACQTFITVYNDTVNPSVDIKGHGRESRVTITLTDHGYGIDSDGITLLPDQGSGVAAYAINDGAKVDVPDNPHEYSFDMNLSELEIYKVEVWDECGNYKEFSYNTTRVEFVDESGRRLDTRDPQYATYYVPWDAVSGGGEIGELPEVPASSDAFAYPAGWAQVGGKMNGQLIGPNTPLLSMLDLKNVAQSARVITLKPAYTKEKLDVTFKAEGGTFGSTDTKQVQLPEGSALSQGLLSGNDLPTKTGYKFVKWVLASNNADISTQQVLKSLLNTTSNSIELKAVWEIGKFDLKFDANGGTLGTLKKRTLQYGDQIKPATEVDQAGTTYAGNSLPTREGYIFMGWSETKQGVLPNDAAKVTVNASLTMGEAGYTVYATWKKDTSRYIIHFNLNNAEDNEADANGQKHDSMLNDASRLFATEKTYPTLSTPSRAGYTFDGWFTAATGGTKVQAGNNTGVSKAGDEITLYAQWKPATVNYTVVYYTKKSATDGDYKRFKTETRQAPTKSDVSLSLPADQIDIPGYWFNANATGVTSNYNQTLTVSGDGSTQFNLYYDRMLTIDTSANTGGTIDAPISLKEGETAQVNWTVQEGYQVKQVLVDGQLRDDLKTGGVCNFTEPVVDNRSVRVVFEKLPEPTTPGGTVGPVTPPIQRKAYTVATEIRGCGSGDGCTITPTRVYDAGTTAAIAWAPCGGCTVSKVEVDGEIVAQATDDNPITTTSLNLTGLAADHTVVVYVTSSSNRPTLGGTGGTTTNDGYYTITVNRYGGDTEFETSSTRVIPYVGAATADWTFEWNKQTSKYRIYEIRVNGGSAGQGGAVFGGESGTAVAEAGIINLKASASAPSRNYVVDVYFYELEDPAGPEPTTWPTDPTVDPVDPDDPPSGYVVPDFGKRDEWITVTTQIIGGAGEIDGSFVAKKEENVKRTVTYHLDNDKDPNAADYAFYEVKKVEVTGDDTFTENRTENEITITLSKDADVKVYVEPVTHRVQTLAVTADENGAVLPSTTIGGNLVASRDVGMYGNFTGIAAQPRFGYRIGAVEVPAATGGTVTYSFSGKGAAGEMISATGTASASTFSLSDMPRLAGDVIANSETLVDDATPLASLAQLLGVQQAWADETLNGPKADPNVYVFGGAVPQLDSEGNLEMMLRNVTADQRVVVYFVAESANEDDVKKVVKDREDGNLHMLTATIVGADGKPVPGAGVEGDGFVAEGADADLTIIVPAGYQVVSVGGTPVAGDAARPSGGRYNIQLPAVTADTDLAVVLAPIERPANPVLPSGFNDSYKVTTTVRGYGALNITPSKEVPFGTSHQVVWAIDNVATPQAEGTALNVPFIIQVEVDGVAAQRQDDAFYINGERISTTRDGEMTFAPVDRDHQVTVTSILMNEDTDNDGKPDRNVDTDNDGIPDTNVDTNGDGLPDVNVVVPDPENPGETIKLNEDKDGDGKPDVNIVDADGDGKPDNIDPDVKPAPLPNVNVDTDNDGKPDRNMDTDGDGKPDVNIVDTDNDGKPDPVNPNNPNPPLPNVNVDTNGDGEPDLNVDTDGDGKPDANVVDTDGDGKPDGIDPKASEPPAPNVNVVVPDPANPGKTIIINKDVDGDGIPDINIDTDGDGVPDVNIDTSGDNIPDVNIDTDGTGQWMPSTMGGNKDGIWKPDTAIDTGDGQGPVHFDYTEPVDGNGDGVDDRWAPTHKDGDGYGTVNENWTQDTQQPNGNGGNGGNGGNQAPSGDNGNNGGNGAGNGNGPGNGGNGNLAQTGQGDGTGNNGTGWNPLLSQTGQTLSQTADENLPMILLIGAAFVVSSLIVAAARRRNRGDDL